MTLGKSLKHSGAGVFEMSVCGITDRERAKFAGKVANVVQQRTDDDFIRLTVLHHHESYWLLAGPDAVSRAQWDLLVDVVG